jgi:hypothetical protein
MDLVHEYFGASIQTRRDRVIKSVLEPFLFPYDTVEEVRTVDVWSLNTIISNVDLQRQSNTHQLLVEIDLHH